MCKKNCLSCQFLCTGGANENQVDKAESLTTEERRNIENNNGEFLPRLNLPFSIIKNTDSYFCYKLMWKSKTTVKKSIVMIDRSANNPRGNSCFYREFCEDMSLLAAEELEKRETKQAEAAADRKLTKRLVMITGFLALATLVTCIVPLWLHWLDHKDQQAKTPINFSTQRIK